MTSLSVVRFFLYMSVVWISTHAHLNMKSFSFLPGCTKNMAAGSNIIDSSEAASFLECSTRCAENDACEAFNACKGDKRGILCELVDTAVGNCGGLTSRTHCKYREKGAQDYNPCMNGGTWYHRLPCDCLPGWAGTFCERLVRDCKEGIDSGVTKDAMTLIQPVQCPYSFQAFCQSWGNTYLISRTYSTEGLCPAPSLDLDKNWDDLSVPSGALPCEYFQGLQDMWYLLRQGTYNLHVHVQHHVAGEEKPRLFDIYYWNFQLSSEADGYKIQYTGFTNTTPGIEDGLMLGINNPTPFCTKDRDCGNCANTKGVPWWYTPNCDNYPLTGPVDEIYWPIDGVSIRLTRAVMQFSPTGYHW